MAQKKARPKTEYDKEACVNAAYELLLAGLQKGKIKLRMHNDYGMPFNDMEYIWIDVKKRLIEETEIIKSCAKELNLVRLMDLYENSLKNNDRKSALSCLEQIAKLQSLYTQKVEVDNKVTYKLKI